MKKFLIIGSCLLLIFSFTACGKKDSAKGKNGKDGVESGSAVEMMEEDDDFDPTYMPGQITDPAEATSKLAEIFSVDDPSKITSEKLAIDGYECYLYKVPFGSRELKVPVYKTKGEENCHYKVFVRQDTDQIIEDITTPVEYSSDVVEDTTEYDVDDEAEEVTKE
jgi:hypothetical protein